MTTPVLNSISACTAAAVCHICGQPIEPGELRATSSDGKLAHVPCFRVAYSVDTSAEQKSLSQECIAPPGVVSRADFDSHRLHDLASAVLRYNDAGIVPKIEWVEEALEIVQRLNKK